MATSCLRNKSQPGKGNGKNFPLFLSGKCYGQRSLVGYRPWGHKSLTGLTTHTYLLSSKKCLICHFFCNNWLCPLSGQDYVCSII